VDKLKEKCGIFGIYAPGEDVGSLTYYGLYALQHRGQESAGIAVADGHKITLYKGMGLVPEVFSGQQFESFHGHLAIGHVRYSTTGASQPINAQPLVFRYSGGMIGLAHNGNLTNVNELQNSLASTGSIFQTTTDSEVIVNLIARYSQTGLVNAIRKCMISLAGAYSLVILTEDKLIAIRDPRGFRPLCIGLLGNEQGYVVASESCALDTVGAHFIRDVNPGEIVIIDKDGLTSIQGQQVERTAYCIFEYVYFARPDSYLDGFHVNQVRRLMGRRLAQEYPVKADLVIPVPDSGVSAARGYAESSGIPYEEGLMKNRYIGRTFIQPSQDLRDLSVRLKLNPAREILVGKTIVLVDDSLVRGTTSGKLVRMLKECGVKEIHFTLSSPPVAYSCYYGIDTSNKDELIAAKKPLEEIRQFIGADGLYYLSIEGLLSVFGERQNHFCTACFSGNYPVEISGSTLGKYIFE
jgi:amidophosphoribosyltransferase